MHNPVGNKKHVVDTLETDFHIEPGEYQIFLTIPYILENGEPKENTYMWLNPVPQKKYFSSNNNGLGVNMLEIPYL